MARGVKLTILGCGASAGVPVIGCDCAVCTSPNPKNQRSRVSVLFEVDERRLLVDCSPDMRSQALRQGMKTVDAILFTHDHADHTHGIEDVRAFNYHRGGLVQAWADGPTAASLRTRFGYVFREPKPEYGWFAPALQLHEIPEPLRPFEAAGVEVIPFPQTHGRTRSLGFRVGDMAYSTDVNALDDAAFEALRGVRIWVVDCLRMQPSFSHSYPPQTLEWIARVKPERAILTHMSHELDYDQLAALLPEGVEPAYDGMVIE
jgi:phosphoribosyl 1,2-cyclic phosphate phosphodiesterase